MPLRVETLLVIFALGCGGQETAAVVPSAPAPPPEPPPKVHVTCTDGAVARSEMTPQGEEHFCAKGAVRHGAFVRLHADGTRAVEGTYSQGEADGPWFWFHPNSNKSQKGTYKDGKPVGSWTWWYENGTPREEGDYLNGRKAGTWVVYYESGRKAEEGMYQNDLKNGTWSYFADDEKNAVVRTESWLSGQLQESPKKTK